MLIERLDIEGLRSLSRVRLSGGSGVQVLIGPNGAGKTTVLEAIFLLGYGRSFRAGPRDAVIARGSEATTVFASVVDDQGVAQRLGLRRTSGDWEGRVQDRPVASLIDLFRICPVVCFEPGSHALISGGAELRRAYLDWSVFHVEHDFLAAWRRYQRALKQRNAGLRAGWSDDWLEPWEQELAASGIVVQRCRRHVAQDLFLAIEPLAAIFLPELGAPTLQLNDGWGTERIETSDAARDALRDHRPHDRERGHTRIGAHRADWSLAFPNAPRREHLSRGQEKLVALIMTLAQAAHHRRFLGGWPILLLDDLASELDDGHLRAVLDWVFQSGAQTWITGTFVPSALATHTEPWRLFHVEQGQVTTA